MCWLLPTPQQPSRYHRFPKGGTRRRGFEPARSCELTGSVAAMRSESLQSCAMAKYGKRETEQAEGRQRLALPPPSRPEPPRCACGAAATLAVTRWFSTEHFCDQHAPPRRHRALAGPVPTMRELAEADAWVWAHCGLGCNYSAAIPLAPVVSRIGSDASSDRFRAALKCTACGKRGATIRTPSWNVSKQSYSDLPFDRAPPWARRYLANAALSGVGVRLPNL
jgi:hypothetical protein